MITTSLFFISLFPNLYYLASIGNSECTSTALNCLDSKKDPSSVAYNCTELITLYYCINRAYVNCSSSSYSSKDSDLFKFDRGAGAYT